MNAHDRQALARIEETLADADPQFAARMSAFSRLTDDEAVPEREQIRGNVRHAVGLGRWGPRFGQPGARGLAYWIAVALAVAITLAVISAALLIGRASAKEACAQRHGLTCVRQATTSAPQTPSGQQGSSHFLGP